MAYRVSTQEGCTVRMTADQTARYEDEDETVIAEIAANLMPGYYSIYAEGYLAENIQVLAGKADADLA